MEENGDSGKMRRPAESVITELKELERQYGQPPEEVRAGAGSQLSEYSTKTLPTLDKAIEEELKALRADEPFVGAGHDEGTSANVLPGAADAAKELELYDQAFGGAQGSPVPGQVQQPEDKTELPTPINGKCTAAEQGPARAEIAHRGDENIGQLIKDLQVPEQLVAQPAGEAGEEDLRSFLSGVVEDAAKVYVEPVGELPEAPDETGKAGYDPKRFYTHVIAAMKKVDRGMIDAAVVEMKALLDEPGQEELTPDPKTYAAMKHMLDTYELKSSGLNIKRAGLALILNCTDQGQNVPEDERPAFIAKYSGKSTRRIIFALRHPKATEKLEGIEEKLSKMATGIGRGLATAYTPLAKAAAKTYAPLAKAAQAVFYTVAEPSGVRKFIEYEESKGLEWDRGEKVMVHFLAGDFAAAIYFSGGMAVYEQYGTTAGFAPLALWTLSAVYELLHRVDVRRARNALGKPEAT
jgi:hypothetical protein